MEVPLWNSSLPPIVRTSLILLAAGRNEIGGACFAVVRGWLSANPHDPIEVIAAFAIDPLDAAGFQALLSLPQGRRFDACGDAGCGGWMFAEVGTVEPICDCGTSRGVEAALRKAIRPHLDAAAKAISSGA